MKTRGALLFLGIISASLVLAQPLTISMAFVMNTSFHTPTESQQMPTAQEVGDNRSFWALNFDTMERYIVEAHLLAIGDHCYIYFNDLPISILWLAASTTCA